MDEKEKQQRAEDKAKRTKRAAAASAAQQQNKKNGGLKAYFKGVRTEMKKVVWPTRKETIAYTIIVLVTCIAFGLLFWGLDTGVLALLKATLNITL